MSDLLTCGEVARRCGVSPDTVRHYERLGLVPPAQRTQAGYRQYPDSTCRRVQVVRAALRVGLTLRQLGAVFTARDRGALPCHEVRRLATVRLGQVEEEIRELLRSRRLIKAVLRDWDVRLAQVRPGQRAHLLEALLVED